MREIKKRQTNRLTVFVLIMIIGVGLITVIGLYFWLQQNRSLLKNAFTQNITTPNNSDVRQENAKVSNGTKQEIIEENANKLISGKAPFLPSKIARDSQNTKKVIKNQLLTSTYTRVGPIVKTDVKEEIVGLSTSNKDLLRWHGSVGTKKDRIVIVQNGKRAYFLRLGDKLEGTNYKLAGIEDNYILLISPNGQLKLERKMEEKEK